MRETVARAPFQIKIVKKKEEMRALLAIHSFQIIHVNSFVSIYSCQVLISILSFQFICFVHAFRSFSSSHSFQFVHVKSFTSISSFQFIHFNSFISSHSFQVLHFNSFGQFINYNSFMSIQ